MMVLTKFGSAGPLSVYPTNPKSGETACWKHAGQTGSNNQEPMHVITVLASVHLQLKMS